MVATELLKLAIETDEERKARLKKMVATTLLKLAPETEDERRATVQSFENGQALILVVFRSFSRLILSLSFLCSSVYVALFALSFSFLSERFSSVHAKAAIVYSRN